MNNEKEITFNVGDSGCVQIQDTLDQKWMMRITKGKVVFNTEEFPNLCENEFAYRILKCMERANVILVEEVEWYKDRIKKEVIFNE